MLLHVFFISSFFAVVLCNALARNANMVLHEQRDSAPPGFILSGSAPSDQVVKLKLALVQGDMASLEEALYEVSVPSSPMYGIHLSKEEVCIIFTIYP